MKSLLEVKEATIQELQSRINKMSVAGGQDVGATKGTTGSTFMGGEQYRENMAVMSAAVREREEQIEALQEKVAQASK